VCAAAERCHSDDSRAIVSSWLAFGGARESHSASLELLFFVVRARDRAGNRDSNKVELQGVNLCV
jgi:hypothetical protein